MTNGPFESDDRDPAPLEGYDLLPARSVMRRILDLPSLTLERLHSYEDRHLRRTSVLRAIRRALERQRRSG